MDIQLYIERFKQDGFVIVKDLFQDTKEFDFVVEEYDRLMREKPGYEAGNYFDMAGDEKEGEFQMPEFCLMTKYAPHLKETEWWRKTVELSQTLLTGMYGEDNYDWIVDHGILKPPHCSTKTNWHQDEAYWPGGFEYRGLSAWTSLQPTTTENGCMQMLRGSYKQGLLTHRPLDNNPGIHFIETEPQKVLEVEKKYEIVNVELPKGGVVFHHNRSLHSAGVNQTGEPRRGLIICVGKDPIPIGKVKDRPWIKLQKTARMARAEQFAIYQNNLSVDN